MQEDEEKLDLLACSQRLAALPGKKTKSAFITLSILPSPHWQLIGSQFSIVPTLYSVGNN